MHSSNVMVSVIMNCYNSDRFLKEAIDSIYSQEFDNWEIIFWDNCSSDNSAAVAKSYDSKLKYYLADKHTALGAARNLAVSKAKGKYIAFLDCDDVYLPNKLALQAHQMEKHGYALSYGSAIIIGESGAEIRREVVRSRSGNVFSGLLARYEINMQTAMIRRSVLIDEQLNFDESMSYCPDYKLFMQIASRHDVGVLRDFLVKYRIVQGSLSQKTIDLAPIEIKYSLDSISSAKEFSSNKYEKQLRKAYKKLFYYDAIAALSKGDRASAKTFMRRIIFNRPFYLAIYFLLNLPLSDRLILKLLKR